MRAFERDDMALSHLMFTPNEVFRFARSRECTVIEDARGSFEMAHAKLCASRTHWLIAYLSPKPTRYCSRSMPGIWTMLEG